MRRARHAEEGGIVRYTAEELDEMIRQGESRTDWAKVDAMTRTPIYVRGQTAVGTPPVSNPGSLVSTRRRESRYHLTDDDGFRSICTVAVIPSTRTMPRGTSSM
jgi:hypothetical protein